MARDQSCGSRDIAYGRQDPSDISENKSPELSPKDIVSKHMTESGQNLIGNLRGGGRKRARGVLSVMNKRKKAQRACVIKRDIT